MYVIKVDTAKCTGDGECVDVCPTSLLTMKDYYGKQVAVFSDRNEDCLGCEACVSTCPAEALTLGES
jgi:ferredoxin